jgi:protein involved in polysaccharide export with SLBB domain
VIWKLVFGTIIFLALLTLVTWLDRDFLTMIPANEAIPVSTGDRIEIVVTELGPLSGTPTTDIYWLESTGTFTKKTSLDRKSVV